MLQSSLRIVSQIIKNDGNTEHLSQSLKRTLQISQKGQFGRCFDYIEEISIIPATNM